MNLKTKIFLLAVVPFLAAIAGIGIGVRQQATALAATQHSTMQAAYLSSKEIELRHYVDLATSAIAPLYDASRAPGADVDALRQQALAVLQKMDFGPDGYFFVYDMHGRSLMHPREPDLVGRNLWDLRDPAGALTIQQLIAAASHGGGYVRYTWRRPSTGWLAPKLGYVVPLERWGWMVGTGIYLDDVDSTLARIDQRASANIESTLQWLGVIALTGVGVIALGALVLNVSEYRSTDAKLKRLAQQVVESQENERARLSRELHDGISQMLVSVKLLLESALAQIERSGTRVPAAETSLATGLARLGDTLREVRRISHALRPAMLDDLGLAAALEQLTRELSEEAGIEIGFTQIAHTHAAPLPDAVNTMLFRIAQEALTNIVRHAEAARAALTLEVSSRGATLTIADNGRGFDVEETQADPRTGMGLRNMRERLEKFGGTLALGSQPGHTIVTAWVPLSTGKGAT
ncbi:cache domain-containing protein [Paraburkholderia caballeronis]|uniref:Two-component system, NarL family, sensor kinase n=1 Tax=Paraburkholderia caballeronis TaxID=416943 RepID=A0A1H7VSE1_9BURK|nr:cache domain-containing protein [Paraburkholderia caballeronis]PXW15480.1 two-component system NarL family sensor kinase [Paraburkholderia caballeronis]PXW93765.1 two-component system NarL family sensor kinase [Paraburkholderia caballeronis]RAJ89005.1 two-component system NarL family sensor kinase [Paraburkholderia caballeronis]SED99021.1 two-component system, NarL family, sensor kinase [Paraburkholderia caballeronis]SEM12090.1 two-component system, NarL family, sensor kinase [Paraburkholde